MHIISFDTSRRDTYGSAPIRLIFGFSQPLGVWAMHCICTRVALATGSRIPPLL